MENSNNDKLSAAYVISMLALGLFMVNLDASIVNIVLPTFARTFFVDTAEVSRVVLSYLLSFSGFLLIFGRLSDMRGANKIFGLGFLVFSITSIMCALSTSLFMLEIARFLQGIGAAMLASTYGAIVIQKLPAEMRGRAFGFITVAGGAGFAMGSPIGGFLVKYFSWRWIFWINIPIGIFALLASKRLIGQKNSCRESSSGFDMIGAFLSFTGLALLTYLLNTGKNYGLLSPVVITCSILFILVFMLFIVKELRHKAPLLDMGLFSNKHLCLALVSNLAVVMTLDGLSFMFPFFFELARGMSPDKIGLLLMIAPLLSLVISPIAGYMADKKGSRLVCIAAVVALCLATAMICFFDASSNICYILTALSIFGAALAMFFTANSCLLMSHAPEGREGTTSALISFNANLGTLVGVCIFESIFSFGFPPGLVSGPAAIALPHVSRGFSHGAMLAFAICMLAFFASFMAREKSRFVQPDCV